MTSLKEYLQSFPGKVLTTFYRRLLMVVRPLADIPSTPPAQPANLRVLTVEDAAIYYALQPHYYRPGVFEARIAYGEKCFGVFADGQLAHTGWGTVQPNYVPYLRRDLMPDPGDVILFNNHTHPAYRQYGLSRVRSDYLFQYYRAKGCTRAIGLVAVENWVGIKVAEAIGFIGIGVVGCLRLGPWQWDWQQVWGDTPMPKLVKPNGPAAIR